MSDLGSTLSQLGPLEILDILVITFIIYHVLLLVKGTRGWQITLGVSALFIFYYLTSSLDLRTVDPADDEAVAGAVERALGR